MGEIQHRKARPLSDLRFKLSEVAADDGAQLVTTFGLTVVVADTAVWPVRGAEDIALEIQIDDLLAHLTEFWKALLLRQTYPLTLNPTRPSHLRLEALKRWESLPEAQAAQEDECLEAFQDAHDLSRCFAGYFDLPPLWLMRSGYEMLIETGEVFERISFDSAVVGLTDAGNEIADRLQASGDTRWEDLIAAWYSRDRGDPISLLAWSTSLDHDTAQGFVEDGTLAPIQTFAEAANDNNELRLAARMASALPVDQIRRIVGRVRAFPKAETPKLRELAELICSHIQTGFRHHRPYEQGEEIARFVRERYHFVSTTSVDVLGILEGLGVKIDFEAIDPRILEGLAVWGDLHGPAILLNQSSLRHSARVELRRNGGARVTLAHEFCHLLIDAGHTLSAVDILNSRMPVMVEQRARAFAAELLLPSRVAGDFWIGADCPRTRDDLSRFIRRLCGRFNVTKSVAAWKLEHGVFEHHVNLGPLLDEIVPQRRIQILE